MADWLSTAPTRFAEVIRHLPPDVNHSERIVPARLILRRGSEGFVATLSGVRHVQGDTRRIDAGSLDHNWVLDGGTVRPLPKDTPEVVARLLPSRGSPLTFSEVVRLLTAEGSAIEIEADQSVFTPARSEAESLDGSLTVPGLNASLFPYQARGIRWMHDTVRHTGGIILADEMGLGKTIQIIALLLLNPPSAEAPALIVCPTSLIANWRAEIIRFAPKLSLMVHRGGQRTGVTSGLQRAQIVITTYDTVVNDEMIFRGLTWSWLISDEAQAIKNPSTRRRVALARVPRHRTIPMTGTPVETSLLDLWSLADMAIPGLLGSQEEFESRFPDDEGSARAVARITNPVVLRRRVADVAGDLPERIDMDVPLELGPDLSARYEQVLVETLRDYPTAGPLVATGQLQLFCAHPWLRAGGRADENDEADLTRSGAVPLMTPKLERTVALLEEAFLSGRKVLIFAIFNRCGGLIREASTSLPPAYWCAINGSTPQQDRQRIVDDFTAHDGPGCLILNPRAAGAGLNITAATIVIHYTQAWNPALEAQASARAHRRGQTEPVRIYRLFYEETVERVMIDRSEWRRDLGNDAVPISTREAADLERALSYLPGRLA